MTVLVDSISRAVASACLGGTPSRLRYTGRFHSLPVDKRRRELAGAEDLLELLRGEVRMHDVGNLRAEAFRELGDLAPTRTSHTLLTLSELQWLTEFVQMAKEGPIIELHAILANRLGIAKSTSQKIALRVRAKGMLPRLGKNKRPDWRPTDLALSTVAEASAASSPTSVSRSSTAVEPIQ